MIAEIIAVGNEVVDGSVVNSNASYLSEALSRQGITVRYHAAVPDEEKAMRDAFATAHGRSNLVLVTGGLGPTVDDFTLEIAADFFGKPLVVHEPSLERIRRFFQILQRPLTPNQEKQARLPEGATVLENPEGTAPGAYYQHQGVHFAFFPGVPKEMKAMYREHFLPILEKIPGGSDIRLMKVLRCFGLPEGQMDDRLRSDLEGRLGLLGTEVGFRVRFPTIDVRLVAKAHDASAALSALREAEQVLRQRLQDCIYGEAEDELAGIVLDLMKRKSYKLATAESCTGGLLASQLTDIPGASDVFLEGVVTYSDASKIDLLGVEPETIRAHGAVSSEVALEMARGIAARAQAEIGIAITGIAGPGGGTPEKPVGTVHLAIVHPGGEWQHPFFFPLGRERFKILSAASALDRLRKILSPPTTEAR